MSSYITRYCESHGEWDQCVEKGIAPSQLEKLEKDALKQEIESLRSQLDDERKHSDIIVQQRNEAIGDLSQAKEDIETLREQVAHEERRAKAAEFAGIEAMKRGDEWARRAVIMWDWIDFDQPMFKNDYPESADWFEEKHEPSKIPTGGE